MKARSQTGPAVSGVAHAEPHRLSVLIPVYNEARTITALVEKVLAARVPIEKEVLIGDDGSTDGTRDLLARLPARPDLRIEFMPRNVGRGGTLKHLLTLATGDIIVHQDADLEYDPDEYARLLEPLLAGSADVVYGSRFKGNIRGMAVANNAGNRLMSGMARVLYGVAITDLMTCYKLYRRALLDGLTLRADGFHFEAELTAKLARRHARFAEVPISFVGRTMADGKKIKAVDALYVIQKLVACRFEGA